MSNKQIAAAVRLAPSTCHERIRNLQTSGVIRGAHADVDLQAVGLNLEFALARFGKVGREATNQKVESSSPFGRTTYLQHIQTVRTISCSDL
jgi:DNA-binding Lrp family transcriptional regulator